MTFIPTITRKAEGHAKSNARLRLSVRYAQRFSGVNRCCFLPNQVRTMMITGTLDDKASALVAKLRLNCCQRILDKMDDKTSPEGMVFATIVMEAKTILQAMRIPEKVS